MPWVGGAKGEEHGPGVELGSKGAVMDRVATRWAVGRRRSLPMGKDKREAQDVPAQWGEDWTGTEALESQMTPC